MNKLTRLIEELESIELHDADISSVNNILQKAKSRIDGVVSAPHPDDNKDTLDKLKEASTQLGNVITTLSDIQGKPKDGK